jgi:hypothetical protein
MDDAHSKQVCHFLTEQQTELEEVNYPDLPNGNVMQSIGTREIRLCSRTYLTA